MDSVVGWSICYVKMKLFFKNIALSPLFSLSLTNYEQ